MIASGYTLIGAADFNADGKPDYVLYRPSVQGTTLCYLDNNVSPAARMVQRFRLAGA